jgi:hypothetical protein
MKKLKLFLVEILNLLCSMNKKFVEIFTWIFVGFTFLFGYALISQFMWGLLGFTILYASIAILGFYIYFNSDIDD